MASVTNGDTAACTGDTSFTISHRPTYTLPFLFSFLFFKGSAFQLVFQNCEDMMEPSEKVSAKKTFFSVTFSVYSSQKVAFNFHFHPMIVPFFGHRNFWLVWDIY